MMIRIGIYKIVSKNSGEFYIGSSQNLRKRELDHFSLLRNKKHPNRYLQSIWNKYQDLFFVIIEECSIESLVEKEQYYIDTLSPKYNLRPIAESNRGWIMSEESKLKISKSNKGKTISIEHREAISTKNKVNLKGRKLSDEHIESIRKSRIGVTLSKETKDKIRLKAMGRDKGKVLSEDTKLKIGLAFSKEVYQYSLDNKFISKFTSCSEVERILNINKSSVASCCRLERKSAGGYKWYYEKQNN